MQREPLVKGDHSIRSKQTVNVHFKLADEDQVLRGFFQPFVSKERQQIPLNSCRNKKAALDSVEIVQRMETIQREGGTLA